MLFAHRDKKYQIQVLLTYEVFSFELHIYNWNKDTYETLEHAYLCTGIPVTITHVKENRKKFYVDTVIFL
jgi:hypothetical protein